VDLPVGQVALQQPDHGPAIGERLELGRCAQVAEEIPALLDGTQRQDGLEQGALGGGLLAWGDASMALQGRAQCNNVIAR
jgi:hypothetical protein